jgi:RNA polymerase sigma factor (sigma-70 family)
MDSDTRATLLERLRGGSDALVWGEFFDRYWRLIHASARRRGCSEHTAEEIVQDVMLAIFEKRDVFRYDPAQGRFRDWLAGVVRNKVAQRRRRPDDRIRGQGGDLAGELLEREADGVQPDDHWEAAFEEALLVALLELVRREVNPRTYQAFELSTLQEMSGAEVAKITGQSRNAVYLARRKVFSRLKALGAPYRKNGQLTRRVKQVLQSQPRPSVERSMTTRFVKTMRSREGTMNV